MPYPEPTVGAVIFNPDGKVLLCRSHKWNDKYVIPGGHIELGERMEEALRREIREETGLEVYDVRLISITESVYDEAFHQSKHFIFIDYACRTDSYEVVLNDEAQEYRWISLQDIDSLDVGGFVRPLLRELAKQQDSKYRTEIFYAY